MGESEWESYMLWQDPLKTFRSQILPLHHRISFLLLHLFGYS